MTIDTKRLRNELWQGLSCGGWGEYTCDVHQQLNDALVEIDRLRERVYDLHHYLLDNGLSVPEGWEN